MFEQLDRENFEYFYRQRVNFHMEQPTTGEKLDKLVLNEIFVSEQEIGKTSVYKLKVDSNDLGRFKSSGLIISTGTGSSGWLFSARRTTQSVVRTVLQQLGTQENQELVEQLFSKIVSQQSLFPAEDERMYYFIREGYAKDLAGFDQHKEGFARELEYFSELIEGRVYIDGHFKRDIGLGEVFTVDTKP